MTDSTPSPRPHEAPPGHPDLPVTGDPDRAAVYAAEDALSHWLDLVSPDAPEVRVHGRLFTPEPDVKFSDPGAAAVYVEKVMAHLADGEHTFEGRELLPVSVRARRGAARAEYRFADACIGVPSAEIGGRWALRGLVVLHEVAHHLLGRPGHGPDWRATFLRLLEAIGQPVHAELLHLAYADEGVASIGHEVAESTLEKIAKLLRQGEASANPHEQDAFLSRAQRLASTASVALAVARAHGRVSEAREEPTTERVSIGKRGQRGLSRYVSLLLHIAGANDVRCTIAHGSVAVTMHGFPSDLATTKALYESLMVQMVTDFERYRVAEEAAAEWVWNDQRGEYEFKVPATLSRRLAFYEAYGQRVGARLNRARREAVARATAAETTASGEAGSSTTELALRQKEVDVHDFFHQRLRAEGITSTWRGDRSSAAARAPSASSAGTRAADRATLGSERSLR